MMTRKVFKAMLISFMAMGILGTYLPSGEAGRFAELLIKEAKAIRKAVSKSPRNPMEAVSKSPNNKGQLDEIFGGSERAKEILIRLNSQKNIEKFSIGPRDIEAAKAASNRTVGKLKLQHSLSKLTKVEIDAMDSKIKFYINQSTNNALIKTYGPYPQPVRHPSLGLAARKIETLYTYFKKPANLFPPPPNTSVELSSHATIFKTRGGTVRTNSLPNIAIDAVLVAEWLLNTSNTDRQEQRLLEIDHHLWNEIKQNDVPFSEMFWSKELKDWFNNITGWVRLRFPMGKWANHLSA